MSRFGWLVLAVVLGACVRETRPRGGAVQVFHDVPFYRTPEVDRCEKFKQKGLTSCDEGRMLGEVYVRRLAVGDEVCLEGAFGESGRAAECLARAAVADTAENRVLIEVREARPNSSWFDREQRQFWFEEGALVDLYLKDHGY